MAQQRTLTGLALALVLAAVLLFLPPAGFALAAALAALFAAWEWAGLSALARSPARIAYVAAIAVQLAFLYWHRDWTPQILLAAGAWWALALLWVLQWPGSAGLWGGRSVRCLMGVAVLVPAWLGLVLLREAEGGIAPLVFLLVLVAAVDIGSWFVGRGWGRRLLLPAVSPGKTWAGFAGGMATALLVTAVATFHPALPAHTLWRVALLAAPAAVLGDLVESMVKRHAGVKDSGRLLPGHGGVLDRVDSLAAAAPLFALSWIL